MTGRTQSTRHRLSGAARLLGGVVFTWVAAHFDLLPFLIVNICYICVAAGWLLVSELRPDLYRSWRFAWYVPATFDLANIVLMCALTGGPLSPMIAAYLFSTALSSMDERRSRGLYTASVGFTLHAVLSGLLLLDLLHPQNIFTGKGYSVTAFSAAFSSLFLGFGCFGMHFAVHGLYARAERARRAAQVALTDAEAGRTQLEELNALFRSVSQSASVKSIMETIMGYMRPRFNVDYYAVFMLKDGSAFPFEMNFPPHFTREDIDLLQSHSIPVQGVRGIHAYAAETRQPVYRARVKQSAVEIENTIAAVYRMQSFLCVPLIVRDAVIGFVDLSSASRMHLTRNDIFRILIVCDQVAGQLQAARLLEETRMAREELEKLSEVTREINSNQSIQSILENVFTYITGEFPIRYVWLVLHEPISNVLYTFQVYMTSHDLTLEQMEFLYNMRLPLGLESGSLGRTFEKRRTFYLPRVIKSVLAGVDRQLVETLELASILQVPLSVGDSCIGVLCLSNRTMRLDLSRHQIESLNRFATQIAGALRNSIILEETQKANARAIQEQERSEKLLLNILPGKVAAELKKHGRVKPVQFHEATVMFTDFKGFTTVAEKLTPEELLTELDGCFSQFDDICRRFGIEKLKTVGDSYMCAAGIPEGQADHAFNVCLAALEIRNFMNQMKEVKESLGLPYWELRIGVHSGPVIAGVVGNFKFAYDIWGDTVNTASRMESSGQVGEINISQATYEAVQRVFQCDYRGQLQAKNKGMLDMFILRQLRPAMARDSECRIPGPGYYEQVKSLTGFTDARF